MTVIKGRRASAVGWLVAALVFAACGDGSGSEGVDDPVSARVFVSAASSLSDAFAAIEATFEESNLGVDVVLNLAGSASLREQILEGAPADVFASANTLNMDQVTEAGDVDGVSRIFARNLMQIAVPVGNPAGVTELAHFQDEDLLIGLCADNVPCGDFARQALAKAGVTGAVDTNEPNVRFLLTKIEAGELDAGIVYVTDVASTDGGVEGIDIPDAHNVVAEYPIAVLRGAPNSAGAAAFVAFVLSDQGREILTEYGFSVP